VLNRGILTVLLVVSWTNLNAQEISNRVVVVAANVANGGGYTISQTIGEPVVEFISSDDWDLTQGFQQPGIKNGGPIRINDGNGVKVYPNPVINNLMVDLFGDESRDYKLTIFGIEGSLYFQNTYYCNGEHDRCEVLDLSDYKRGLYFIMIETTDKKISRLFKITKM